MNVAQRLCISIDLAEFEYETTGSLASCTEFCFEICMNETEPNNVHYIRRQKKKIKYLCMYVFTSLVLKTQMNETLEINRYKIKLQIK